MTYREKLKKEYPEKINLISWGGCEGCPGTYDYSDDEYPRCPYGRPNGSNCSKCWDREIPEKSAKPEEFGPGTSYAEFTDGHKEEITFYERADAGGSILFATRSGVYLFKTGIESLVVDHWAPHLRFRYDQFYRVEHVPGTIEPTVFAVDNIKLIAIDTRVKHDYCITLKDDRKVTGSVWVERGAPDEKIQELIWDDAVVLVTTETTDA